MPLAQKKQAFRMADMCNFESFTELQHSLTLPGRRRVLPVATRSMHILGINYSNDAAAALVRDGEVIAACKKSASADKAPCGLSYECH